MLSVPSRAPDVIIAYNTSSTSLEVSWSRVSKKYFNGKLIGYNISYFSNSKGSLDFVTVDDKTNITLLTKLRVYTEYAVTVSAVSSGGVGPGIKTLATTGEEGRRAFLDNGTLNIRYTVLVCS